jgi:Cu(I)/Ag(I) efflux system membrane fusion protein
MSLFTTRTIVLAGALLLGGFVLGRACAPHDSSVARTDEVPETKAEPTVWTCSMHPQVQLPASGKCPICFMDLIPLEPGAGLDDGEAPTLVLSEAAAALAEIETAPVERRFVAHEVRMVGKIAFDETRTAYITARVPGRLDRLFVDYTGVAVREGDHLLEIYSPEFFSAQQELLQSLNAAERLGSSGLDIVRNTSESTVRSAREKLRLLGMSQAQIEGVVERGRPDEHVTVYAPIGGVVVHKNAVEGMYVDEGSRVYTIADFSKVWVLLDAYESDIAWLRYGQDVSFEIAAYPGESFHGRIAFIDPVLDNRTRTVKVRLIVDNENGRLKPDMFVSAVADAKLTPHGRVVDAEVAGRWMCPMHPEVLADDPAACTECGMDLVPASELGFVTDTEHVRPLVVPAAAPLLTGERAVVYVRLPGRERPTFEGREVVLGPRAGDWYVVNEGLTEGEQVVVNGNFKLDSELQIRSKPSMMGSPEDHPRVGAKLPPLPDSFRTQLATLREACRELEVTIVLGHELSTAQAAEAVVDAFVAVEADVLALEQRQTWKEAARPLWRAARDAAGATDLDEHKRTLRPLLDALEAVLAEFGVAQEER